MPKKSVATNKPNKVEKIQIKPFRVNLEGRINNLDLPKEKALVPIFEAIINSFYAIEERRQSDHKFKDGKIAVLLIREHDKSVLDDLDSIVGFEIFDNGIGFNSRNMNSFLISDTSYKADVDGEGIGRFTFLKVFSDVKVTSVFYEDNTYFKREFNFDIDKDYISDTLTEIKPSTLSTSVRLFGFKQEYRDCIPKDIEWIAKSIVPEVFDYFPEDCSTKVFIFDGVGEGLFLNDSFKQFAKIKKETYAKSDKFYLRLINVASLLKLHGEKIIFLFMRIFVL
jgi:hypothetical protein